MSGDPPVPPAWGIYAAALTVALTAEDETERAGARRLIDEIGIEQLAGRERRPQRARTDKSLRALIRETLEERLSPHEDAAGWRDAA